MIFFALFCLFICVLFCLFAFCDFVLFVWFVCFFLLLEFFFPFIYNGWCQVNSLNRKIIISGVHSGSRSKANKRASRQLPNLLEIAAKFPSNRNQAILGKKDTLDNVVQSVVYKEKNKTILAEFPFSCVCSNQQIFHTMFPAFIIIDSKKVNKRKILTGDWQAGWPHQLCFWQF